MQLLYTVVKLNCQDKTDLIIRPREHAAFDRHEKWIFLEMIHTQIFLERKSP